MAFGVGWVVLSFALPAWAVSIAYDTNNRPTSFQGISLDGTLYDVSVTWDSIYSTVYSAQDPLFLGDEPGAYAAVQALGYALEDDG